MAKSKRKPTPTQRQHARGPVPAEEGDTALRLAVAERSRGFIVLLSRQPQFLIPSAMLVLMLVGLAAPLVFAVPALIVIEIFVSWLAFLSWPVIDSRQRFIRAVMVIVVALALVGRLAGWI